MTLSLDGITYLSHVSVSFVLSKHEASGLLSVTLSLWLSLYPRLDWKGKPSPHGGLQCFPASEEVFCLSDC